MSDINLLPENLRDEEAKARQQSGDNSGSPKFYNPKEPSQKPVEGSPPGRWQQLISALTKNVNSASGSLKPASPEPAKPPSVPVKPVLPESEFKTSPASVAPVSFSKESAVKPAKTGGLPSPTEPTPTLKSRQGKESGFIKQSSVLDVNLIPAQESGQVVRRSRMMMLTMLIIVIVLVGVVYFALNFYVKGKVVKTEAVQQEITLLQQQLETARTQTELAIATQLRLGVLADLLNQQGQWGDFFKWLENNTIKVVQLTSLAVDASGTITVTGQAPNFTEVGRQMLAFSRSQDVEEIILGDLSLQAQRTKTGASDTIAIFTFDIKVKPELFVTVNETN
ncbi:MAG TPA: hypothetical protein DDW92_02610 [Candidatus Veblenbacteria bacterium]|uniref:PilN domain-containing protein n=2 Tax=Candidatus Vebleniibacteriota TaxID=1817921 RepID=A0A1G2Q7Q7_9BACT|nr:MAG: hypothetical protein UV92_C0010G0005 [Parcubacteria group bacterium GW2011_GWA1_43_27]KKT22855.1 MAG: hypothetical protein UW06_C0004G0023 [Parcubacteria group bacterium GW2011_GWE1_43_8]KKT28137.1 MAG: hypothetical protein UW12_C0007G0018 [Parcubacteria group bacterium GW2011_GWF1_43_9]OHA54472.1 MAG: hypothetical protein A2388_02525 [Candidatus Veblenbacteria bacterium RIFOXYB1_FULL_43_13]OHA56159.1 MAG: hypothetical protein A2588_01495 [Candidatus Veblenbacteria bacterium RIFOXYD1_FU